MWAQLTRACLRLEEIETQLSQPETYDDPDLAASLNKEQKDLLPLVEAYRQHQKAQSDLDGLADLLDDPECRQLAKAEETALRAELDRLEEELRLLLQPKDPMDGKDVFLEIRAGVGGEEAALFAADLFRMYSMYGEKQGWRLELKNVNQTELGGVKELSCLVKGETAYARLKHESGVHRVQRVPETESGGRIHTSTCTVAVLPQVDEVDFTLDPNDLRIDTFRASGAGGQHINKTSSAVRLTHLPTGIVVFCQTERSQFQNRDNAMKMLRAKLAELKLQQHAEKISDLKGVQMKIEWGSQIRSYVFMPYTLAKDTRTGYEMGNIQAVMDGDIDGFINAYLTAAANGEIKK